ncbi:MAG: HEAT repeat domain-containing protein, partial [Promethearchaeota archaeon]
MIVESIFLVLFITFCAFGFYIINKQVSLVKKGEFAIKDRFLTIFYGIVFSFSVMVVIVMAFIFTVKTPEFWTNPSITPPDIHPLAFLLPFLFCLFYISIYPMIDFLFIAFSGKSSEGLTIFHKFLSKHFINFSNNRVISILMAVILYVLFAVPPFVISLLGIPFVVIWISWMLIYPITILTFFGSKGYIAGISNAYYHIPDIKRYSFLNFEDANRGFKQFFSEPLPYITFGMMLFVFVWAWISLIQTIVLFFTGRLAFSTMSSVFVFVTLFFGVIGYFTRFWGRKIKYRGIDIYFSAYLIAAIGINVLINFLIVNSAKLGDVFSFWSLTNQIVPNYLLFSWAAIIEEITMIIFTSYYFLSRRNDFVVNLKISKITQCGQKFDPIPLFNLLKSKSPEIHNYAEETLLLTFERLAIRSDFDLNSWKYKKTLLDGLSDPNKRMRKICAQILHQLSHDMPNLTFPWLIEELESSNYTKSLKVAKIILGMGNEIASTISNAKILNLLRDSEWKLKLMGVKLALKLKLFKDEPIAAQEVLELLNDPSEKVQLEILDAIVTLPYDIPVDLLLKKINHPNKQIRAKAISNLARIKPEYVDNHLIQSLIPYMKDPSGSVRASIYWLLAKMGGFKKNSIKISQFLDALSDADRSVREASISVLNKFYEENPNSIPLQEIINKLDKSDQAVKLSIIELLGDFWALNSEKILNVLLRFIKTENEELKSAISTILVDKFDESPDLIFQKLIVIKDDEKFLSKGVISNTIIKIAKEHPERIYEKLIRGLDSENE